LIRDGAKVALNPDDVLSQIKEGYVPLHPKEQGKLLLLSDEQSKVYPHITLQPVHLDELAKQSGFNISSLMNITLSLELKRAIRQLPGQYYVRNQHA
jgi:DNA processing protein